LVEQEGMATKFRETMWFKMGEQAQEEAEKVAAAEAADEPSASVAMLPIEDRYGADASMHDTKTFGLHTGMTNPIKALRHVQIVEEDDVPMKSLVREMKKTKRNMLIGAGAAVLCVAFALYIF
jgi:hypothetical protein